MLLDSSVLIAAHKNYYAPRICPGFWDCISHHISTGQLVVIDHVRAEITRSSELDRWLDQTLIDAVSTSTQDIADAYREIMDWVQSKPQFTDAAKEKFARGADGWLVAYAMVNGTDVATEEVFDSNIRRKVKIPNVCKKFEVNYLNTYKMLHLLGARFDWAGAAA